MSFSESKVEKSKVMTYDKKKSSKKSVVTIVNDDNSCGYRATTLGVKYHELKVKGNSRMADWRRLREHSGCLFSAVIELLERYEIDDEILDHPLDDERLKLLDEKLSDYQIIVIDRESGDQLFVGTDRPKVIYLESVEDHYNLITSMSGYRARDLYCKYCSKGYQRKDGHICKNR